MKIRNTITLIFTLLTGTLLLVIFFFIYYFSGQYTESEFYLRLKDRAIIAAQVYLEKDEVADRVYEDLLKKHQQILSDEAETIVRFDHTKKSGITHRSFSLPGSFRDRIYTQQYAYHTIGDFALAGILYRDNQGDFLIIVSARDLYGKAKMKILINILILSFLVGVVITYFVGWYYAGHILKPISALIEKANKISATNLDLRLPINHTDDELDELAATFNNLLDRLETAFEMQNNFVNNASHELRNPLTAILGETEIALSKERNHSEYQESLWAVQREAQKLDLLVSNLLKLAQTGMENKRLLMEYVRIDELLLQVCEPMNNRYPDSALRFNLNRLPESADQLVIRGNPSLLMVALNNVVDNACKFSPNKEVVLTISTTQSVIEIKIRDWGVGIPQSDVKNIVEPFYRASNARGFRGFGIGLSLSQRIIKLHNGQLNILSEENKGTCVIITLPHEDRTQPPSPNFLI